MKTGLCVAVAPRDPLSVRIFAVVEVGMPWLYHNRTLRLFPVDIDRADYAVVIRNVTGSAPAYTGVVNFFGPEVTAKANTLILARMKRDRYDFSHPVYTAPNGLTVLRRVH